MNTIKKLKVNKKARCLNKRTALRLMAGVGLVAVLITVPIAVDAFETRAAEQQNVAIVSYYGEDSVEKKLVDYIKLSEAISELNLKKFNIDNSLYEKYNISNELKSPGEIYQLISQFKEIGAFVSTKNITKQNQIIEIVLNLATQEKLVNSYIYTEGYSIAHTNIKDATKKYAAEVFGIEDSSNVYFDYRFDNSSGTSTTKITDTTPTQSGIEGNATYKFNDMFLNKEEKNIKSGVISMVNTDVSGDENKNDNDSYNHDRNDIIRDALANSVDLELDVKENDLYNEKMTNRMK